QRLTRSYFGKGWQSAGVNVWRPVTTRGCPPFPGKGAYLMRLTKTVGGLLGLLFLLTGPAWAADKDQIARAQKLLEDESNAKGVLFFMHPTPTLTECEYRDRTGVKNGKGKLLDGHFALHYRYHWKGGLLGDNGYTDVIFFFDDKGKFEELQVAKTTSPFAVFTGANLVIDLVKDAVLEEIDKGNDETAKKVVRRLIENVDAKGLLEFMLKWEQAKR